MILPVYAYGHPVLKKKADDISPEYPELEKLIDNMFETMYHANGVGLAAPQIGLAIRLFIVDTTPFADDEPELKDFKEVFINAQIIEEEGTQWRFNEGCLSIPGIREDVERKPEILIRYQNRNFETIEKKISGLLARVIQHEYDHIDGILFTDRLSQLRKTLIKSKLLKISKGIVDADYKMKFASNKR
jgi:peptide deformylase